MIDTETHMPAHESAPTTQRPEVVVPPLLNSYAARVLRLKLRSAVGDLERGRLATASALLFEICRSAPDSFEAIEAKSLLEDIALRHERSGRQRLAVEVLERLEGLAL